MQSDIETKELIARIARKDRAAFDRLYRHYERAVFSFIDRRLNDPFAAADILHDVFLDVWKGAAAFKGQSTVKTWIYAIAYRKVMDLYRRQRHMVSDDEIQELPDSSPQPVEVIWAAEEREMLNQCLSTLKPEHRIALELTFYEDMTYAESAEVMNVPEGTMKTRVFHAKKLLLHCLQTKTKMKDWKVG